MDALWVAEISLIAGTVSVVFAVFLLRWWDKRASGAPVSDHAAPTHREQIIFLFKDKKLIDATPSARRLLQHMSAPMDDWQRLLSWIEPRFPQASAKFERLDDSGKLELSGDTAGGAEQLRLRAERLDQGLIRLTLSRDSVSDMNETAEAVSSLIMEDELGVLRRLLDSSPMLVWRENSYGQITWSNATYLNYARRRGEAMAWPIPRLLDVPESAPHLGLEATRAKLNVGGASEWFDCYSHPIGDQRIFFALPADSAVRAERNLRDFVQTLTKTFAGLHIGLVIFDHNRNLQLFNPALVELTGLPIALLTTRPTLVDFLDQLRERRMVPEPKDYGSWRSLIGNLEAAASSGYHVEEWSLLTGQTFRVTGCPHPDGAIAFLFEDITTEIDSSREARAEMQLSKAVLDYLEEAVIVFTADNQVALTNRAYRQLWGNEPANLLQAAAQWKNADIGPETEALIASITSDQPDDQTVGCFRDPEGGWCDWTVRPVGAGHRLVRLTRGTSLPVGHDQPRPSPHLAANP